MTRRLVVALVLVSTICVPSIAQPRVDPENRERYAAELEDARRGGDLSRQASSALLLGLSEVAAGHGAAGRAHLAASSELFAATGDHFGRWIAVVALAELRKNALDFDGAAASYASAIAVLENAALPGESFSIETVMALGAFFGIGEMPLPVTGFPQELLKPILMLFADVVTRSGYGAVLLDLGQIEKAEAELARAQQGSALFGGFFDSSLAARFGDLRRRQWRFDEARTAYTRALRGVGMLPGFAIHDDKLRVHILEKLADIEMLSGRTEAALAWNDEALALARGAKDVHGETSVLRARANLLLRARRYIAAHEVLEQALTVADAANADSVRAEVLRDHGLLDMMRGRYGSAAARLEKSIAAYEKSGDVVGESHSWSLLAELYTLMELQPSANVASARATELAQRSGSRVALVGASLAEVGRRLFAGEASFEDVTRAMERAMATPEGQWILARNGRSFTQIACDMAVLPRFDVPVPQELTAVASSAGVLLDARALIERREFTAARAMLVKGLAEDPGGEYVPAFLLLLAGASLMEGDLDEAVELLHEAADAFETTIDDIRVEEILTAFLGGARGAYFELLIETLVQKDRITEAFDMAERARSRAFLRLIANSRIDPKRNADAQLIREADALRISLGDARADPEDLRRMRERFAHLMTRIKTSSPEYASLASALPLTAEEVRADLPAETTLVSYFATRWGVHVWIIDDRGVQHVRLPDGAAALAAASCWSERIGRYRGVRPADGSRCAGDVGAEDVHRVLFSPIRERLLTRRLLLVVHGALHYVPFAALRNPDDGRYVIEDFTLLYLPSASTLRHLRAKESPVVGNALVFGDPATGRGDDLPHAATEAIRVAAAVGAVPLLGEDAMESRLYALQEEEEIDIVHIAAHGVYEPEHPLFSRIALAPGEGRDGDLEVHEILGELDLSGVNLVVLAACDSGVVKRSGGDDVVGLTRAVLYAGAPGVVATLWKIGDEAAAALIEEFYCRLRGGDSVAEALRGAQLAMLHGGRFHDARDWGAFSLYGDPLARWDAGGSTRSPHAGQ